MLKTCHSFPFPIAKLTRRVATLQRPGHCCRLLFGQKSQQLTLLAEELLHLREKHQALSTPGILHPIDVAWDLHSIPGLWEEGLSKSMSNISTAASLQLHSHSRPDKPIQDIPIFLCSHFPTFAFSRNVTETASPSARIRRHHHHHHHHHPQHHYPHLKPPSSLSHLLHPCELCRS